MGAAQQLPLPGAEQDEGVLLHLALLNARKRLLELQARARLATAPSDLEAITRERAWLSRWLLENDK